MFIFGPSPRKKCCNVWNRLYTQSLQLLCTRCKPQCFFTFMSSHKGLDENYLPIFKWTAKALSCSQISKSVWAYKQWSKCVCILIQPSIGISCLGKKRKKKKSPVYANRWRGHVSSHMKIVYKGNFARFILVQVFCAGGKEPRKQQNTHEDRWTFTHLSKHICPFTPIFQFMFVWTFCLCSFVAFS